MDGDYLYAVKICGTYFFTQLIHFRLARFVTDTMDTVSANGLLPAENTFLFRDEGFFTNEIKDWHENRNDNTTRKLKQLWRNAGFNNPPTEDQLSDLAQKENLEERPKGNFSEYYLAPGAQEKSTEEAFDPKSVRYSTQNEFNRDVSFMTIQSPMEFLTLLILCNTQLSSTTTPRSRGIMAAQDLLLLRLLLSMGHLTAMLLKMWRPFKLSLETSSWVHFSSSKEKGTQL